jgi:hypothetical protein
VFAHYGVLKKDVTVTVFWIYLVYFQNDQIWKKENYEKEYGLDGLPSPLSLIRKFIIFFT